MSKTLWTVPVIAGFFVLAGATGASAAPTWIECTGERVSERVVDGKTVRETGPIRDYYIFDDANKTLSQYFEATKSRGLQKVTAFSPAEIKWAYRQAPQEAHWEGTLDRAKMTVSVVRRQNEDIETRTATCKPTQPREVRYLPSP